jgi:hypothetical protein
MECYAESIPPNTPIEGVRLTSFHLIIQNIGYSFGQRNMLQTLWARVRQGKIELLDSAELPEGVRVLVTLLPDDETEFWLKASQTSLNAVWDNTEDDVYAQLLEA